MERSITIELTNKFVITEAERDYHMSEFHGDDQVGYPTAIYSKKQIIAHVMLSAYADKYTKLMITMKLVSDHNHRVIMSREDGLDSMEKCLRHMIALL